LEVAGAPIADFPGASPKPSFALWPVSTLCGSSFALGRIHVHDPEDDLWRLCGGRTSFARLIENHRLTSTKGLHH
jgi:hypothetical protein